MAKKNYYAVASGKRTGIFDSWDEARPLVERVRGALTGIRISQVGVGENSR